MKFLIQATCLECGEKDVEAQLFMSQGSGCLNLTCRNCGAWDGYDDQSSDIEKIVDIGNGIRKMREER